VSQHLNVTDVVAAGMRALPGEGTAFACTQAAYRFYANEAVSPKRLAEPLVACARQMSSECEGFALVIQDQSDLPYTSHTRKRDRLPMHTHMLGYTLLTTLLISDRDGAPVAPIAMSLFAADGIHTTREEQVQPTAIDLDESLATMRHVAALELGKPSVFLFDREWDSIHHLRAWAGDEQRFVLRARASPRVVVEERRQMALGKAAEEVELRPTQAIALSPTLVGQQFVGEMAIEIERPAVRPAEGGRGRRREAGERVAVRLVVSEIRTPDEGVVARWLLVTNVEAEISAETIAQWYVWRWKIESYFKLMKGAGQHLEQWQQESAEAILNRLLVASMSAVVVWHLARAEGREVEGLRELLIRLSGRQMRRERPFTEPALMAGFGVLLAMLDALEHYSLDQLRQMARTATMGLIRYGPPPSDSG